MSLVSFRVEGSLVVAVCEGHYPSEALRQAWEEVTRAPGFPMASGALVDLRRSVSLVRRPVSELRATMGYFAMELAKYEMPCALLVEGVVRYGLMRMVTTWVPSGVAVRVFQDEGGAREWLATTRSAVG